MRHLSCSLVAVGLLMASAPLVRADDKEIAEIVDKAIKAAGGEKELLKYKAATWKGKGVFYGMGEGIAYTGDWYAQHPNQMKAVIEAEAGGQKFVLTIVADGDKGWRKTNDQTVEMDKDQIAEQKQERHVYGLASLVTLKSKDITLASLGESKIKDRAVVGLKATKKGFRDVNLYFDKEKHVLVKVEATVKDEGSGQELLQEVFYDGYKEVDGLKMPTKFEMKRDGKLYLEGEILDYKRVEKLDDSTFAKP